jgi:hypothetical protein
MSYAKHKQNTMGVTNNEWGVCGFTSCFYALHRDRPGERGRLIGFGEYKNVLAEISKYLTDLKSRDQALVGDINAFCQTFEGYATWTVDDYINRANDAIHRNLSEDELKEDSRYSIGMPPHAVVDYLKHVWKQPAEVVKIYSGLDSGADGIVGVRNVKDPMPLYDGLCHWVYRRNNVVMSWGRSFGWLTHADAKYEPVRLIRLK